MRELKKIIEDAGVSLTTEELEQVTGGQKIHWKEPLVAKDDKSKKH